ncbi:hypothetical protein [Clostridium tyrobutyricum]|nr:hypothetical protein [Clostridium tyrobutyricum]
MLTFQYNHFSLKTQQSELIRSINNSVKRNLNSNYSFSDSISIESGKQLLQNQKRLASLNEIQGKNIKDLYANNNILDLDTSSLYKLQTSAGTAAIYQVSNTGNVYMPYQDLGLDENFTLPQSDYGDISKISRILSGLAKDQTAFTVRFSGSSAAEIKDTLSKVGIKPGWFEIKSESQSNRFYLTDGGLVYPEYQIQAQTRAFKDTNWLKDELGYSSNSKFIIDGKTYKLDQNGYLNLPDNVDCVMENIKIIK